MTRVIAILNLAALAAAASASPSGTSSEGSIVGSVRSTHGQPLPFANAAVLGTQFGAISRDDGSFAISGVAAGTHTVQCSYIGFQSSKQVVTVVPSRATTIEFNLEPDAYPRAVTYCRWRCPGREVVLIRCRFGEGAKIDLEPTTEITRGPAMPQATWAPAIRFALAQSHPNPTKTSTTIDFALAERRQARVRIYDATGRLVRSLLDESLEAGSHSILWDGHNERGNRVSSGIYFYRLEAGNFTAARQLVILP